MSRQIREHARVIVVEDDAFTRATLCGALRDEGVNVVGDAASGSEALALATSLSPHAAVIDLDLGGGPNGIDVAAGLREAFPTIGIVILTSYDDPRLTGRNVDHMPGGTQYLTKGGLESMSALAAALGDAMYAASDRRRATQPVVLTARGSTARLTDTQMEVAGMVAEGLSNAEIAARRGVSPATVERIIMRTARALGIESTSATNRRVLIAREYMRHARDHPRPT